MPAGVRFFSQMTEKYVYRYLKHQSGEKYITMNKTQEKYSWLKSLLEGWGIKECWAKIIAVMLIGALAACGLLSSCTAGYTQSAQGDIAVHVSVIEPKLYCK